MPTGLQGRLNGRYYIRRRIPLDLVPFMGGKAEITKALGTADPKAARRLLPLEWAALDLEFDAVRLRSANAAPSAATSPKKPKPVRKAPDRYASMSREQFEWEEENAAFFDEQTSREEFERDERKDTERQILAMVAGPADGLTPEQLAVRDLLRDRDYYRRTAEEQASNRKAELQEARAAAPQAPSGRELTDNKAGSPVLDVVLKKWSVERRVKPKGFATHHYLVGEFIGVVGDLPVAKLSKADVLAFKDKLLEDGDSLANVKVKLSRLRTLLNYAVANDYIQANPANDVRVVVTDADRNKRKPFDLAGLKTLFGSPIYTKDERPTQGRGEAAYWLPILGLYTGARLEELGQLRPTDVREEEYLDADDKPQKAWFIHVTEDEEEGLSLKNAGSERVIPLHPVLESLGFPAFVQAAQKAESQRLFPLLRADKFGRVTAKWGEWFGAYKRGLGITDKRLVFHSLRHTFKQFARGSQIEEGVQRQIMGHSSKDVADSYGDGYPMHRLVEGMRSLRIPGLEGPRAPPAFRAA